MEGVLANRARQAQAINPALIVRVTTTGSVPEDEWIRAGLNVLATNPDSSVVLFATDGELEEFRRRLGEYRRGAPRGRQNPAYAALIESIERFEQLGPEDRIGPRLQRRGVTVENFAGNLRHTLDVELWDIGTQDFRAARVNELSALIEARGGEVLDRYVGITLTLFRVTGPGAIIQFLLDLDDVAFVDDMPIPDDSTAQVLELNLGDLPAVAAPERDAPNIGIIDSGLTAAHPLLQPAVGNLLGIPEALGSNDVTGHGTRVASIALYGDIRSCIENRRFAPQLRVHSVRVTNDRNQFDDSQLIVRQIRDAITALYNSGCRIFNISLCDRSLIFDGGKASTWAAALDELAREMNVVIVLAAGNYQIPPDDAEVHVRNYPRYLLAPEARILDPATAMIPLTVGSIAEAEAVPAMGERIVGLQPVARAGQPSPFTRSGPGLNDTTKPDLCDFGGNLLFDGNAQTLAHYDECAIVSFNNQYLRRLFMTGIGTSLAAPRVAHKAAIVQRSFAESSANLVRALLASSATVPRASCDLLGDQLSSHVCGYGVADVSRAVSSAEARVVLYADASIGADRFYVYEVPVPQEFSETPGQRYIQITLAYDPPTRRTRIDYLGITMSYRLIRGATLEQVIEHQRRRADEDGPPPEMPGRYRCDLSPGPAERDRGTLQRSRFTMQANPRPEYGDTYHLVVRCERKWAGEEYGQQRFALVVEIAHPQVVRLYERVRERIRIRLRA